MGYPNNYVLFTSRIKFGLNHDHCSHRSGVRDRPCHVCSPSAMNLSQEPKRPQTSSIDLYVNLLFTLSGFLVLFDPRRFDRILVSQPLLTHVTSSRGGEGGIHSANMHCKRYRLQNVTNHGRIRSTDSVLPLDSMTIRIPLFNASSPTSVETSWF